MSGNYTFNKPVFIIGNVRSGTTILSDILSQHKDVAFWLEPKYIWRYGNAAAKHDRRTAKEASSRVRNYIQKRFFDFTQSKGKTRFMEKTPSNVFRIPFMYEVFPNALFVNIIRNGRDSSLSAEKKWTNKPDSTAITRRLTSNEIPITELPYYGFAAVRDILGRTILPSKGFIWGQQFEGIHEYRKNHSVIETCAMQWAEGQRISLSDLKVIPEAQKISIRYEDISSDLSVEINRVLNFLELPEDQNMINYAKQKVFNTKNRVYSDEDKKKLQTIEPIIKEQMNILGYK